MNKIIEKIIEDRKGMYCHALEVEDVYELEAFIEQFISDFQEYGEEEIIDFFETIELYALNDENEEEIYNFNFREHIQGTI